MNRLSSIIQNIRDRAMIPVLVAWTTRRPGLDKFALTNVPDSWPILWALPILMGSWGKNKKSQRYRSSPLEGLAKGDTKERCPGEDWEEGHRGSKAKEQETE